MEIVDRPFSLWERVQGETLGLIGSSETGMPRTWRAVGEQLAILHTRVKECADPHGYLDHPAREFRLEALLGQLVSKGCVDKRLERDLERLMEELRPIVQSPGARCFLHGDMRDMNIMCSSDDHLLAIIDWGMRDGAIRPWISPIFRWRRSPK